MLAPKGLSSSRCMFTVNIVRAVGASGGGYLRHAWSLTIEERFDLLWPLMVIVLFRRRCEVAIGWVALGSAEASALGQTRVRHPVCCGMDQLPMDRATILGQEGSLGFGSRQGNNTGVAVRDQLENSRSLARTSTPRS